MRSELIPGETVAAIDQSIVDYVDSVGDENPFPFVEKTIAVANEAGRVYRILTADGAREAIAADKFLTEIGCVERPTKRYNSLFHVPIKG
ncbi:hypothetical protein SAMN05443026_3208 [Burkholderia orbicola]|nr:hypothetical protein SAMN05443026_3208 [Burkholderia orbicola]